MQMAAVHFLERNQPFLGTLYCTLFSTAYYGLFKVGQLTAGNHPVLAKDVHVGYNKKKMLFVLHTSKTHNRSALPQLIKISSTMKKDRESNTVMQREPNNCPFELLRIYAQLRGGVIVCPWCGVALLYLSLSVRKF